MSISVRGLPRVILYGVRKRDQPWLWITVQMVTAGILASTAGHAQTPSELLSQTARHAEQGNWFRAAPLYAKAEKEFHRAGDRRNELHAKFGRLHGDAESGSYRATRAQVVRDITDPLVEGDPQLKIQALALLGNIDLSSTEYAQNRREMEILRRPPASLSAIRRQMAANESLIEFVLDTKKSYALEVSQGGLEVHELPGRPQIELLVTQFLSGVRKQQESGDLAKALYSRVLSPALGKHATSVIVVPDGSLHLLPFGALIDGEGV